MQRMHGSVASAPIPQRGKTVYLRCNAAKRAAMTEAPKTTPMESKMNRPSTFRRVVDALVEARYRSVERQVNRMRVYTVDGSRFEGRHFGD